MTYGTSHLLIGGGRYFQGGGEGVKKKILLCKGRGHYMKNKNIEGGLSTQPDQQKMPQCKTAQKISSLVLLTRHFTKFIFLE